MSSPLFFRLPFFALALLLGGCATMVLPPLDFAQHPANPAAESAPRPTASQTLNADAAPPAPSRDRKNENGAEAPAHDHGSMHMHGAAPSPATPPASGSHGAALYACPMHPEVTSDKPARCPTCGMALEQKST